jgi:ABC-type cobalamin/Fe3+-siderophores transport system ATPase subunit
MKEATQLYWPSVSTLLKAPSHKDVFHILLLGSNGCGKSTFLDSLI